MINSDERLLARLNQTPFEIVRSVFIQRTRMEKGRIDEARAWLRGRGYEEIEADDGQLLTDDGREILRAQGKTWALSPQAHLERKREAQEMARKLAEAAAMQKPKTEKPGESLTSVLCPSCHAVMAKAPVCPNCSKGKAGFKILCACTDCGHEVYL